MKTITLDKNSWHYRIWNSFARTWFIDWHYPPEDICSYVRSFFHGSFISLTVFAIGTLFAFFVFWLPLYFIISLIFGLANADGIWFVGAMILILEIGFGLCLGFSEYRKYLRSKNHYSYEKKPSFIVEAYRAHKEKYCARIKFE